MNEKKVVSVLQTRGSMSRVELSRQTGISYPTVSRITAQLLEANIVEENGWDTTTLGRPAKVLRIARETVQVIGLTICPEYCDFAVAGLDGDVRERVSISFRTPKSYDDLLDAICRTVDELVEQRDVPTLGLGVSVPGVLNYHDRRVDVSPGIHLLDGHRLGDDLRQRLAMETIVVQSMHAIYLAERTHGLAAEADDFAVVGIAGGLGLAVRSGGRMVQGHRGLAGELGHIVVDPQGEVCGCGKRGCLETIATDLALSAAASKKFGRPLEIDQVVDLVDAGELNLDEEIDRFLRYLAIGLSIVINLLNPKFLFVYGRFLDLGEDVFLRLVKRTSELTLEPLFCDCTIVRAERKLQEGTVATIIHHLTDQLEFDVM
jgi:N-acetylglucosamine repressor